jgi:hypothetical protein
VPGGPSREGRPRLRLKPVPADAEHLDSELGEACACGLVEDEGEIQVYRVSC